jgi:hypothetical protein
MTDTHTTTDHFDVLHALRVRGLCSADGLAETSGLPAEAVRQVLEHAAARELVKERTGRLEGWMLTGAGRQEHADLYPQHVSDDLRAALAPAYDAFLAPNERFKQLTTSVQTGTAGSRPEIVAQLESVHDDVSDVVASAERASVRYAAYGRRFEHALVAYRDGDDSALARPMSGSYHDVWMELHEDLLVTLGRERTDEDG